MDLITTLQHVIKFIIGLLLALLPFYDVVAQEAPKKIRLKYIEHINGVETVKDTTITVTDRAALLQGIKGLKIDTAALHKLNMSVTILSDSLRVRSLAGSKAKIHKLSEMPEGVEKMIRLELHNNEQRDKLIKAWKQNELKVLSSDSLRLITVEKDITGDAHQLYILKKAKDQVRAKGTYKLLQQDSLHAAKIEHIYIRRKAKPGDTDSLIILNNGKTMFKGLASDSTADKHFFRFGEEGDRSLKYNHAAHPGKTITIIVKKVTVQDMTETDIATLKKTGTPVETKAKETLDLKQIDYYPNPNDGKFNLRFTPEDKGTTIVRVLNSKGQEVFVDTAEKLKGEYNRQIDLTPFGKGLYFLQLEQGKRYFTKKILVR